MKIVRTQILSIFMGLVIIAMVSGVEVTNQPNIRPNIADLNNQMKIIRPLIEKPYIPQEVERLSEPQRKVFDQPSMTNALLVGSTDRKSGEQEKPSMYSTVIQRHATSVVHPVPQPVNYGVRSNASAAFAQSAPEPLVPGAYSIPVQIGGGNTIKDPTLSGYETPNFIHKGEKVLPNSNIHAPPAASLSTQMEKTVQQDIEKFVSQFENSKDKADRIKVLLEGKERLGQESNALAMEVVAEIEELLFAKEVAMKMNKVLGHYETKLRKDQLSQLKLADEVTVKNILRDKLHRELQGFRTSPGEYKELEMVNPADIAKVIQNIKLKVGQ